MGANDRGDLGKWQSLAAKELRAPYEARRLFTSSFRYALKSMLARSRDW